MSSCREATTLIRPPLITRTINSHYDYFLLNANTSQKLIRCKIDYGEDRNKYLEYYKGVTVDTKLSFDDHINQVVNKATNMTKIICKTFSFLDRYVHAII